MLPTSRIRIPRVSHPYAGMALPIRKWATVCPKRCYLSRYLHTVRSLFDPCKESGVIFMLYYIRSFFLLFEFICFLFDRIDLACTALPGDRDRRQRTRSRYSAAHTEKIRNTNRHQHQPSPIPTAAINELPKAQERGPHDLPHQHAPNVATLQPPHPAPRPPSPSPPFPPTPDAPPAPPRRARRAELL